MVNVDGEGECNVVLDVLFVFKEYEKFMIFLDFIFKFKYVG